MRINSKGLVTIPAYLRKRWGLTPGTEIVFGVDADGIVYFRRARKKLPIAKQPKARSSKK